MDVARGLADWTSQFGKPGRDVLERAETWELYEAVNATGLYPYFQTIEENFGPKIKYKGADVLMFGSNNYLGLTVHPRVQEAAIVAVRKYGTAMTGSRFLNGTTDLHEALEHDIAEFLGAEAGLVFTTGYQANLGLLTALINVHSTAVIDRGVHASVYDGARLAEGKAVRFAHNSAEDLERALSALPPNEGALVVVDGVCSMEGDLANLRELIPVVRKHGARIAVDDAHGLGVLGDTGQGTSHYLGMEKDVDIFVGTFSKSLASIGGFVAGSTKAINFIKHFARPMVFSASLAPSCVAAAKEALAILREEPERAQRVRHHALTLRNELRALGFTTGDADSAIVPVFIGDAMKTFMTWNALVEAGVYTNPVFYPAIARGREMLRTSCVATHTEEHLHQAVEAFAKVGKSLGLI